MNEMNTTPLIDVMLVLLIMFIITRPIMTHSTLLNMPQAGPGVPPRVATIEIDADSTIVWNGTAVRDLAQFESFVRAEANAPGHVQLQIRPDRRASYDTVAKVLAVAQRNHLQDISITGTAER